MAVVMISGGKQFDRPNHPGDPFYDFIENELPEVCDG